MFSFFLNLFLPIHQYSSKNFLPAFLICLNLEISEFLLLQSHILLDTVWTYSSKFPFHFLKIHLFSYQVFFNFELYEPLKVMASLRFNWILLEKAMAPHSSILAWKIPWTEKPGRLQCMGLWRVGHDWATSLSLFTFMRRRRKWQPTPVFLPGEPQGPGSLGGLPSMGSHRVGHDWCDLAAATLTIELVL